MLPYDFYKLGISSISVVTFVANIQYSLRTGDYFSGDSAEWPLLHTWSLSVEEQYYFFFPILLFILLSKLPKVLDIVLLVILAISFILAEYMSRTKGLESFSYYLIFTRMGELLVGSKLAIYQAKGKLKRNESSLLSIFAFSVLVAMLILVNEKTIFPGIIALILCFFTAVLINSKNRFIDSFLENKYLIYIGLTSYSLYLFHWPVLAFLRYIGNSDVGHFHLSFQLQILAIILTFSLSLFSYHFVETPLRKSRIAGHKVAIYYFLVPTIVLIAISTTIIYKNGMPERLNTKDVEAKYQFSHIESDKCTSLIILGCAGGDTESKKSIILYGNSHGEHYFKYVDELSKKFGYRALLYAKGGCSLIAASLSCSTVKEEFKKSLNEEKPEIVVIAFRWDTDNRKERALIALSELLTYISNRAKRVVVLAQPPLLMQNPSKVANCERLALTCNSELTFSPKYPDYNNLVRDITLKSGAEFFDPFDYVDNWKDYKNGTKYYYFDRDHLNIYGNLWLSEAYLKRRPIVIFK